MARRDEAGSGAAANRRVAADLGQRRCEPGPPRVRLRHLHTPLLAETRHLINASSLKTMKKTAHLINASRGPVVDEAALAQALRDGSIAGAGLDVFENEPDVHPGLLGLPNVVLAPHIGSASHDTRVKMAVLAVENCLAVLEGKTAAHADQSRGALDASAVTARRQPAVPRRVVPARGPLFPETTLADRGGG